MLTEALKKEIQRMLFLANLSENQPLISENTAILTPPVVVKEATDDGFDLDSIFDPEHPEDHTLGTKDVVKFGSKSETDLPAELKFAMVANDMSQMATDVASMMHAPDMKHYEPRTRDIKRDIPQFDKDGQGKVDDEGNIITNPVTVPGKNKFVGAERSVADLLKRKRFPITYTPQGEIKDREMNGEVAANLSKWFHKKDDSLISWTSTAGLSETGRAQVEFLVRVLKGTPKDDTERAINDSPANSYYKANAEAILYSLYFKVLIPFALRLTNRTKYSPNDLQLNEFIETALRGSGPFKGVLQPESLAKYNIAAGNFGAWAITSALNRIKDQIAKQTDWRLNETDVREMLASLNGPFAAKSKLDPAKASSNADKVVKDPENDGVWIYIYNEPLTAWQDFIADRATKGESGQMESSPLAAMWLYEPSKFYKGFRKDLSKADWITTDDTEATEDPYTEVVPQQVLASQAKGEIVGVLGEIYNFMLTDPEIAPKLKNIASSLKGSKDFTIELMFHLLNFGVMVPVYATSFKAKNAKAGVTVYAKGDPVAYDENGRMLRDVNGNYPSDEQIQLGWDVPENDRAGFRTKAIEEIIAKMKLKHKMMPAHFVSNRVDFISKLLLGMRAFFGKMPKGDAVRRYMNKYEIIRKNLSAAQLAEAKLKALKSAIREILIKTTI